MIASIALGAGLATLNGFIGYLAARSALNLPDLGFIKRSVGSMTMRLLCVLILITLVVKWVPVNLPVFIGAFVVVTFVALLVEVHLLHRRSSSTL